MFSKSNKHHTTASPIMLNKTNTKDITFLNFCRFIPGSLLMILAGVLIATGQCCWKISLGSNLLMLSTGFGLYGAGALTMIAALKKGNAARLHPLISVSYIVSAVLGVSLLNEELSAWKYFGIGLVITGVTILAKEEE